MKFLNDFQSIKHFSVPDSVSSLLDFFLLVRNIFWVFYKKTQQRILLKKYSSLKRIKTVLANTVSKYNILAIILIYF